MKTCAVCKEEKELSQYYGYKASKDGKSYRCKACDNSARKASRAKADSVATREGYRRRTIQNKYGLTLEDFAGMLEAQGGRCAICRTDNPLGEGSTTSKRSFSFAVDHCHTTGRIRGLLCNPCNRGIGFLQDDPALLENAANYLRRV